MEELNIGATSGGETETGCSMIALARFHQGLCLLALAFPQDYHASMPSTETLPGPKTALFKFVYNAWAGAV